MAINSNNNNIRIVSQKQNKTLFFNNCKQIIFNDTQIFIKTNNQYLKTQTFLKKESSK